MAQGLYYPDGSFRSEAEIRASNTLRPQVEFQTPLHISPQDFGWWQERMQTEQKRRKETIGVPETVDIKINTDKPILLHNFGDVHAGGQDVAYDLFGRDVGIIRDMPNTYAFAFGDLTDSFFLPLQYMTR